MVLMQISGHQKGLSVRTTTELNAWKTKLNQSKTE